MRSLWLHIVLVLALCQATLGNNVSITEVFTAGEEGYSCYRIPALVELPNGDLFLVVEGRKLSCADHGWNDLVSKTSSDGGKTWSAPHVIHSESNSTHHVTIGNPAPVLDPISGTIYLTCTRNNQEVLFSKSIDGGHTWATFTDITSQVSPPNDEWDWYATGPPGGVMDTAHNQLIVFADHNLHNSSGTFAFSHVFTSNDKGESWQLGGSIPGGNEAQGVMLSNGSLLINMRSADRSIHYRLLSTSDDRQSWKTWSTPTYNKGLIGPICEGSTIRWADSPIGDVLVFSNPTSQTSRVNMTLHVSKDSGASWSPLLGVWPGPAAYSSLAATAGKQLNLAFENGEHSAYEHISHASILLS